MFYHVLHVCHTAGLIYNLGQAEDAGDQEGAGGAEEEPEADQDGAGGRSQGWEQGGAGRGCRGCRRGAGCAALQG